MGSLLDAKRDPTQNNYYRITSMRYPTCVAGALFGAYSHLTAIYTTHPLLAFEQFFFHCPWVMVVGSKPLAICLNNAAAFDLRGRRLVLELAAPHQIAAPDALAFQFSSIAL